MAKIDGIDEMLSKLQEMGSKGNRIVNDALRKGGDIVAKDASRKAPKSNIQKAHLADHIVVGDVKAKENIKMVEIGLEGGSQNGPYFYGRFLERGTKKMNAKPYLEPALSDSAEEAVEAIAEELKRGLGL